MTSPRDGSAEWFLPAFERLESLEHDADPRLRTFFDLNAPFVIGRAPGRLDVMGGIADYSGALVLELPLVEATFAMVQGQNSPRCDVVTRRDDVWQHFTISLDELLHGALSTPDALGRWFDDHEHDRWAAYVVGVVQYCFLRREAAQRGLQGIRLLIDSQVPEGKGVSSSAALEVATMTALVSLLRLTMTPVEIATVCQWVENHVVGAPCGIMDQMTSACGQGDRLLRLRCQPGDIEGFVKVPAGYRFFGIDSGLRHAVTGADYGTVRTAAFMGYRMIADLAGLRVHDDGPRVRVDDPRWRGYLANIGVDEFTERFEAQLPPTMLGAEFLARYGGITDEVTRVEPTRQYPVRNATAHPVREQARVTRFAALLEHLEDEAVARALGRLMLESHASYNACGLGSSGTDRLVALALEAGEATGIYGAKITGGGSGGTVALLATDDAERKVREIASRYSEETGREATVFAASGPGAATINSVPSGAQRTRR